MEHTPERTPIIVALLETYFPIECEMAGTSNVFNVANGITKEVRAEGGANFDISQPLSILAVSVSFINCAINICNTLKKEKKPMPAAQELTIKIVNDIKISNENINKIDNDIRLNMVQCVIDQYAGNSLANGAANG